MKKLNILTILLAVLVPGLKAQQTEYLDANLVKAGIGIGGNLFSTMVDTNFTNSTWGNFQVPVGWGASSIFTTGLWLSGNDGSNNLHVAAQRYNEGDPGFADGPIASSYNTPYNQFFHRVFKVTKQQIDAHRANTFPIAITQVNTALKMWPGKGNVYVQTQYGVTINNRLAPFIDANNDGVYNPELGDYPDICGDQGIFFVFNRQRLAQDNFDIEVRGLAESFGGSGLQNDAITNTVFVSYEIENKSAQSYNDFYLSLFEDIDLGCYMNDRVGCDTNLNLMFGYNGTSPDIDCNGSKGYGVYKVAHGVKFLNNDLATFGYFTNGAPASMSDPTTAQQYRNYATGLWNDGTHFTEGGTGHGGVTATNYIFPGNPANNQDWSEMQPAVSAVLPAGDRRFFGSAACGNFSAGEIKHFDLAFTSSYDSLSTMLGIIDTLKRDEVIVQNFYSNTILACRANAGVGIAETKSFEFGLHPNPSNDQVMVTSPELIDELQISDLQGRVVLLQKNSGNKALINVAQLAAGVYVVKLKGGDKLASQKLVVK
ncbi:MAG: T9SS type A sorting domain-containing protein [Chitinophagales bacterium]